MSYELHAIYEHGVLRPLTPLELPEATQVVLTLREMSGGSEPSIATDPILGLMADDPDLIDQVVETAMVARELHPFRTND
jgi:predicted DNA-binding antitoxin AbrB/MazE fold protein